MPFHPRLAPLILGVALAAILSPPSAAGNPPSFALRNLADPLVMLPVSPGEVVTLAAYDPESERPLPVRWTLTGGAIAHGARDARWKAPDQPGVYTLVGTATVDGKTFRRELSAFVTVPAAQAQNGVINGYRVGRYPALMAMNPRGTVSRSSRAADLPEGFIKLDADSRKAQVSRHFTLGQFETKDGPRDEKYMFLSPRLVTKLERLVDELRAEGYDADGLRIMSGYRTPAYNSGIGNKTTLSRHTYGDAADILADDWNRDGAITEADAQILYRIADRLDRTTDLTGGLSLYKPTSAHGWFVHVDTRGKASRW
ncbi:Peptidase M15 [compost metagenome]